MPSGSFTGDAEVVAKHFTGDAWIIGDRWKHHRTRDHFGIESDLYVTLSEAIGPYPMFTPIHFVIADLMDRLNALETSTKHVRTFTGDAVISRLFFTGDAIIKATTLESLFTGNAWIGTLHSFTGDAWIIPLPSTFTGDAFIV
jgi:hypothetical protein